MTHVETGPAAPSTRQLRILVVEASRSELNPALKTLDSAGLRVKTESAGTPAEFIDKLRYGCYDLILSSCDLSGWTGLDVLSQLRQEGKEIPVILVSRKIGEEQAVESMKWGAADIVLERHLARLPLAVQEALDEQERRTARARSNERHLETCCTLRGVIQASPLGVVALNQNGIVRMWNPGAERLFGWKEEDVVGTLAPNIPEALHEEFRARLKDYMAGRRLDGVELLRQRKDGTLIELTVWTAPMYDVRGHISGVIAIYADNSERKRAEAERLDLLAKERAARAEARAQSRFRQLMEAAPDAILEIDRQQRIVLLNAAAERLFGWSRDELLGQPLGVLAAERLREVLAAANDAYFTNPQPGAIGSDMNVFARRKDGSEFPVEISLSPVQTDDGLLVTCIIRDITERMHATEKIQELNHGLERQAAQLASINRELELRNREVERANRLKSEFLASMSHELRTPLNAIIGFSDLLTRDATGPLNVKQKRFLGHIRDGAHHLMELIGDILDLSRIEAGCLALHPDTFGLVSALTEVLTTIAPSAAARRIWIENKVRQDARVRADRVRLKQILYNLLSNAVKFTPDGGRVCIDASNQDGCVEISVSDTGIGIPAQELDAIFDRFHQVDLTQRGIKEGTGLGLTITRALVELHGGTVIVESTPGEGSRFAFTIPQGDPLIDL